MFDDEEILPLTGFTIGVIADERDRLSGWFVREGARVLLAPASTWADAHGTAAGEGGGSAIPFPRGRVGAGTAGPERRTLDGLLAAVLEGSVDALVFADPAAVHHVLARDRGTVRYGRMVDALRTRAAVFTAGAAEPLLSLGVPGVQPRGTGSDELCRAVSSALREQTRLIDVDGIFLELRSQAVVVDGELRATTPTQMAVLRTLAAQPGWVISRRSLAAVLPGYGQDRTVDRTIGRLRCALGRPGIVQTVTGRGYRLGKPSARP